MPKQAGNSIATAFDITLLDTNIKIFEDTISNTDSLGYYKFTIAENSKLNIKLSGLSQNVNLFLLNADGSQITQSAASGNADENIVQNLRAGSYYFYVGGGGTGTNYKIETSAISLGPIPVDNAGNTFDTAKNLGTLGTTAVVANDFVGNFNGLSTDDIDYYQFTITENSTVNLKLSGLSQNVDISLYDSQQIFVRAATTAGNADENITQNLRAGTYYVYATGGENGTTYQLSASAISLGAIPIDANPINTANNLGTLGAVPVDNAGQTALS